MKRTEKEEERRSRGIDGGIGGRLEEMYRQKENNRRFGKEG